MEQRPSHRANYDTAKVRGRKGTGPVLDESELEPSTLIHQQKSFEIIERLGESGMGKIYKAFDASMDRYIALKVLKPNVPESERKRFFREAVLAANFSHPNLVRVLETGQHGDVKWLAMEHLRGRDIGHVLTTGKPVHFRVLCDIFLQTLDALNYIHTRSIVHCDIKPENIFITRDAYDRKLVISKLIDFGIAVKHDEPSEPRKHITGDPRYMAPEQSVLNGPVDHRADLYALGVTIYETATGRHPLEQWFEEGPRKLLKLQREQAFVPPSRYMPAHTPPAVAELLDQLIALACAKEQSERFQSALQMQAKVQEMLNAVNASAKR